MRTVTEINELLSLLETTITDEVEDHDLGFKLWDMSNRDKSVK